MTHCSNQPVSPSPPILQSAINKLTNLLLAFSCRGPAAGGEALKYIYIYIPVRKQGPQSLAALSSDLLEEPMQKKLHRYVEKVRKKHVGMGVLLCIDAHCLALLGIGSN